MTSTDFQNDSFDETEYYATKFRLGDKPDSTGKGKLSHKQRKVDNAIKATLTETATLVPTETAANTDVPTLAPTETSTWTDVPTLEPAEVVPPPETSGS